MNGSINVCVDEQYFIYFGELLSLRVVTVLYSNINNVCMYDSKRFLRKENTSIDYATLVHIVSTY